MALVVCAIAFFAVLLGSDTGGDEGSNGSSPAGTVPGSTVQRPAPKKRFYRVQPGDSLDGIAQRFGIDIERLQELNPLADPQALEVGQRIKLRE